MPTITRWYLKTSFVYLGVALLAGVYLASRRVFVTLPSLPALSPAYLHLLIVGWITQLIFGVAFWMFPKASRERPRGNENLAWLAYALLNCGLLLRAAGEPLAGLWSGTAWGWLLVLSALFQWVAALAFLGNTWGRVKVR